MKLKLDKQLLAETFFRNTSLLGIVNASKDYEFCWQVNNRMQFDLRLNTSIEIQLHKKNRAYFFSVFEFIEPITATEHYVYNNKHAGEYLIPDLKHMDFLWLVKNPDGLTKDIHQFCNHIRNVDKVQLVADLTTTTFKNKEYLIF
jgi:hypothetical protein